MDGALYITFRGKAHVCNVWFNGEKRKCDLNLFDNDWNPNYWFGFVSYFLHFDPALFRRGIFSIYLSVPTAQHFTDFHERFR